MARDCFRITSHVLSKIICFNQSVIYSLTDERICPHKDLKLRAGNFGLVDSAQHVNNDRPRSEIYRRDISPAHCSY